MTKTELKEIEYNIDTALDYLEKSLKEFIEVRILKSRKNLKEILKSNVLTEN